MKTLGILLILSMILCGCARQVKKEELIVHFNSSSDNLLNEWLPYLKCYDKSKESLEDAIIRGHADCVDETTQNIPAMMSFPSAETIALSNQIAICTNINVYENYKDKFKSSQLSGQDFDTCTDYNKRLNALLAARQWEYVHKIPIERAGNSYVGKYNNQTVTFINVSDEFTFSEQQNNNGILLDVFSSPGNDLPAVYVVNRFGVFKEKAKIQLSGYQNLVLHESSATNQKHYTLVQKIEDFDVVSFYIIHADASDGGFINSASNYVEFLPYEYPFESWSLSVLEERREFIVAFEKRAKEAIQYNPRNNDGITKTEKKLTGTSQSKTRLTELKSLYDDGIINQREYEQKRQSIFDGL